MNYGLSKVTAESALRISRYELRLSKIVTKICAVFVWSCPTLTQARIFRIEFWYALTHCFNWAIVHAHLEAAFVFKCSMESRFSGRKTHFRISVAKTAASLLMNPSDYAVDGFVILCILSFGP